MELNKAQEIFLQYYQSLPRTDSAVPHRNDFRIQDIPNLLGNIIVLEIKGPQQAIITLSGSKGEALLNTGMTGLNIFDMLHEREKHINAILIEDVITHPCAGSSTMVGSVINSYVTSSHNLSVPFVSKSGIIDCIICYSQYDVNEVKNLHGFSKYADNIQTSHLSDIHTYDIGHGVPDKHPDITSYEAEINAGFSKGL